MPDSSWTTGGGRAPDNASAFPCLHADATGRILHCPEFRRVVVEFRGAYLVLRTDEFRRLGAHLRRLAACGPTRSRLAAGERLRLRDATAGDRSLLLDLRGLEDLGALMGMGEEILEFRGNRPATPVPVAGAPGSR